jgi:UDP-3-O-[3-hydroxymyristoyl] N-acetylglucosamine deacetylase
MRSYPRRTVTELISWSGRALHGGQPVRVTVRPGERGFWFRAGKEEVEAIPSNVVDTQRCTQLGPIATIEHLMSALAGLGYTDAEIEVDGGELPALDGSALEYVQGLKSVGYQEIGTLHVDGPFDRVYRHEGNVKIAIATGEGLWREAFVLEDHFIGRQEVEFQLDPETYTNEVAAARTVVLEREMPAVRALGLGKGLDETSCLGIGVEQYMNEPRFMNEPVRHKLLDLIGDLALAGVPIALLNVVAERNGHAANVDAARKLASRVTLTRT